MPVVRKLAAEAVQQLDHGPTSQRKQAEALYDGLLGNFAVGDDGEAQIDPAENA